MSPQTAEVRPRMQVEVHWLGTTLIAALAAWLAWEMGGLSVDVVPGDRIARAVGAWLLVVGAVVAHEAGHVLAGRRLGYRCRRIIVAAVPGVELYPLDGHTRTNRDQLWISRGGPYAGLAVAALYLAVSLIFHTSGFGVWFVAGIIALCLNMVQFLDTPLGDGGKLAQTRYAVKHGQAVAPFDDPARAEVEARIQAGAAAAGIGPVRVRWHRSETTNASTDHARGAYRITVNTGCLTTPDA